MSHNPHQVLFYRLGLVCFIGSVIAGLVTDRRAGDIYTYDALCIALAILSVGFFSLFTVIHLKH